MKNQNRTEIRYKVGMDYKGVFGISKIEGEIRSSTVRVSRTCPELGYRTIIPRSMWDAMARTKEEAVTMKIDEFVHKHESFMRQALDAKNDAAKLEALTETLLR